MEITFVDHGKPWKNQGVVFLNFCGNPVYFVPLMYTHYHNSNLISYYYDNMFIICLFLTFFLILKPVFVFHPEKLRERLS